MAEGPYVLPRDLGLEVDVDFIPCRISSSEFSLKEARERFERGMIIKSLKKNRYNISRAASELGISRPALYDLVKKYDIKTESEMKT